MNIFEELKIKASLGDIDLEMTPVDTYGFLSAVVICNALRAKKNAIITFI